jgi:hypothetical protein
MGFGIKRRLTYLFACLEAPIAQARLWVASAPSIRIDAMPNGRWFVLGDDVAPTLREGDGWLSDDVTACLTHRLDILGTGESDWGERPDWHRDAGRGGTWPLHYHKRLRYRLAAPSWSDVKIPWELSRFQYVMPLVGSYLASKDPKYAQAAVADIADWIEKNPPLRGVNWMSPMEAAIRACNWMWAWWAFREDPSWSAEFNRRFLRSVWQHGWYIERNLEDKGGMRTNHYLSNVVGLLFIGVMFPAWPDAPRWREFGYRELVRCMEEMVYPDGVSFENSTAYHRLVLELFACSAILCIRNGIELPETFWERLEKMFEFIMYSTRPDGRMPTIGDADDGRFFILTEFQKWDRWDFRYLMAIGALLFRRADFKRAAGQRGTSVSVLFGEQGASAWEALS